MKYLTLLLLVSCGAFAAPPVPPEKVTVKVGELSRVEINVPDGKEIGWRVGTKDANLFVDELASKSPTKIRLLIQGKELGDYYIVLWTKGETESSVLEVVVTGEVPTPPTPTPKPTPPTPIADLSGKLKAYLIAESANKTIAYTKLKEDKAFNDYWKSKGYLGFVIADPQTKDPATDTTPKLLKPYVDRAAGKDVLFLVNTTTGDVLYEGTPPATPEAMLTLVKSLEK